MEQITVLMNAFEWNEIVSLGFVCCFTTHNFIKSIGTNGIQKLEGEFHLYQIRINMNLMGHRERSQRTVLLDFSTRKSISAFYVASQSNAHVDLNSYFWNMFFACALRRRSVQSNESKCSGNLFAFRLFVTGYLWNEVLCQVLSFNTFHVFIDVTLNE